MEDVHLGWRFWLALLGITAAAVLGGALVFLLVGAAWLQWGFLGAIVLFGGVLLGFAFIYDRTHPGKW
jgi:hypothetical protein